MAILDELLLKAHGHKMDIESRLDELHANARHARLVYSALNADIATPPL